MPSKVAKYLIRCAQCGSEHAHTRPGRHFCSRDCARQAGLAKLAKLRELGLDPAQSTMAQRARSTSMKKRWASGEILGKALRKQRQERQEAMQKTPVSRKLTELNAPNDDQRPIHVPAHGGVPAHTQFTLLGKDYLRTEERWDEALTERNVLTLDGHGCAVSVERGELVLRPGGSYTRREGERRIIRGVHNVSAIVVMGSNGAISLSAIQWCAAQKVGLFAVDRDGDLTSVVALSPAHNIALRRLQYNADAFAVAKEILKAKFAASAAVRPKAKAKLLAAAQEIDRAKSVESLLLIEGRAAIAYWDAWELTLHTVGRHFPEHWRRFMQRVSPITGSGRKATHPVNAILNYSYAILAGQVQRALESRGFDAAVGHLHSDCDGRPSLVYDLMEPLRPRVDEQVLTWVQAQKWRRADFVVDAEGVVRLHSALGRVVVQKALLPDKQISQTTASYRSLLMHCESSFFGDKRET